MIGPDIPALTYLGRITGSVGQDLLVGAAGHRLARLARDFSEGRIALHAGSDAST